MLVVHPNEWIYTPRPSIFLAGPSRRPGQELEVPGWRKQAIRILEEKGFDGVVFNPEPRDDKFGTNFDYDAQIEWENEQLTNADVILFWVPRDLSLDSQGRMKLPAFTTNAEFGFWRSSGKVVFGAPPNAPGNNYIRYYVNKLNIPHATTLSGAVDRALFMLLKQTMPKPFWTRAADYFRGLI